MGNRRSTIPDEAEHTRLWKAMAMSERRAILRQVRRGQPAESRKQARVAVGVARQQQRYWKFAWLFGPAIALLLSGRDLLELVVSAVLGALAMGALSVWSHRKAVAAERADLELLGLTPDD